MIKKSSSFNSEKQIQCKLQAIQISSQQDVISLKQKIEQSPVDSVNCIENEKAKNFCLNEKCRQKNAFTCNDFKCKCNMMHKKCKKGIIQTTLQMINQKKNKNLGLKQQITQVINKQIQRINFLKQKLQTVIDGNKNLLGLSAIQTQFEKILLNQKNPNQIIGEDLSHLWDIVNDQKGSNYCSFYQIKKSLEIFSKSIINDINSLIENIQSSFVQKKEQISNKFSNQISNMIQAQISNQISGKAQKNIPRDVIINKSIIKKSSIIKSVKDEQKLLNFFSKKVKSLNLIYKVSSQNNWDFKKYFKNCGAQANTIIICLSQENKIIGGFTPLHFGRESTVSKQCLYEDPSNTSFVFSLTNNEKFPLKNYKQAIYWRDNLSINFGWGFFTLYQSRFTNYYQPIAASLDFSVQTYDCLHYTNCKNSNKLMSAFEKSYFPIKKWEVIQVQFVE